MQSLWNLDLELFRAIHLGWHRDWLDPVFWVVSTTGLGWVQLLAVAASFLFIGRDTQSDDESETGVARPFKRHFVRCAVPLVGVWAVVGILNTLYLKQWVGRDRPSLLAEAHPHETFFHGAFPSGHTANAFGMAAVIWFLTRGTPSANWGWGAFLWAAMVGFSRVYRGVHWPTDVIGGAAVGVFSGCLLMWVLESKPPPRREP